MLPFKSNDNFVFHEHEASLSLLPPVHGNEFKNYNILASVITIGLFIYSPQMITFIFMLGANLMFLSVFRAKKIELNKQAITISWLFSRFVCKTKTVFTNEISKVYYVTHQRSYSTVYSINLVTPGENIVLCNIMYEENANLVVHYINELLQIPTQNLQNKAI